MKMISDVQEVRKLVETGTPDKVLKFIDFIVGKAMLVGFVGGCLIGAVGGAICVGAISAFNASFG